MIVLFFVLMVFNVCSASDDNKGYLRVVLTKLDSIESASYFSIREGFAPGDSIASVHVGQFVKEYNNPLDTTIGASFVRLLKSDTTQMAFSYDGNMRATVYNEDNTIVVDSFKVRKLPFRPLAAPFFNYTKNIIRYVLETSDSILLKIEEKEGVVYCCLTIFEDKKVEFFGKAFYLEKSPYDFGETTSKYEIWIDKTTDLPIKCRREMPDDISVESVSNVSLNRMRIEDFDALDYFLPDFEVKLYGRVRRLEKINELIGEKAPDWALQNTNNSTIALQDLKSKVVMIQFTSVSCGPCKASIAFLNQLNTVYKKDDFDFIVIECTSKSLNAIKSYQHKNLINYELLLSNKNVLKEYNVNSFPVFFFLDKDLIIRKVIYGYSIGTTDAEINDIIDKMRG